MLLPGTRGFVLLLTQLLSVLAANPEIADNELGITARACADNYCVSKDSLDLWNSLEWYCHQSEKVLGDGQGPVYSSVEDISQAPSRRRILSSTGSSSLWSFFENVTTLTVTRILTALVSSVLSVVGVLVGFRVGLTLSASPRMNRPILKISSAIRGDPRDSVVTTSPQSIVAGDTNRPPSW